ncbi:MAG: glutathione-disulfide reductase [Bdellovibrionales bacterium]
MKYDFDLFVIGAGSGGVRASRIAAGHGAKVAIAEKQHLGGTCVNVGCVPKKLMTFAASYAHHFEDARGFGWSVGESAHDWSALINAKNAEIERLNGIYKNLLKNAGVELVWGEAKLVDAHTVEVNGKTYSAERILVATGGQPHIPDIEGARAHAITSDDVFYLEELPKRAIVVGAGYIAVEFAGIFDRLGAEVTLIHRRDALLNDGFDEDVIDFLKDEMVKQGIDLKLSMQITKIEKNGDELTAHLSTGETLVADQILFATGRTPITREIGLEEIGVELTPNGMVKVNKDDQTNIPSIYAVGDITDRVALTPVAIGEGHSLVDRLYAGMSERYISYDNIPTAVFSNPPIGTVGLTQAQANQRFPDDIDIYKSTFGSMRFSLADRNEKTLMKLIVQRSTDKVLGLHMVGQDAPEITQGFGVAIKAGATKADFDRTIGIHPTAAEEFVTMRQKSS